MADPHKNFTVFIGKLNLEKRLKIFKMAINKGCLFLLFILYWDTERTTYSNVSVPTLLGLVGNFQLIIYFRPTDTGLCLRALSMTSVGG